MCHIKNNSSSHRANLAQTSLKETGHDESVEMQKWETHGVQFITSQENGYRLIWRPILADSLCNYHATRSTESKPVRVEGLRMNAWDCTRSVCIKMEAKPCGSKKSPWTCHDESLHTSTGLCPGHWKLNVAGHKHLSKQFVVRGHCKCNCAQRRLKSSNAKVFSDFNMAWK